jgi:hypothetical protein
MIFKVSTDKEKIKKTGASATPDPIFFHRAGTNRHHYMQRQSRPRGHPRKRRGVVRHGRSRAPSPSPSHAQRPGPSHTPSPSPSRAPGLSRSCAPSSSPSRVELPESNEIDTDLESDTGVPKLWDPRAGLKPLRKDDLASDVDIEIEGDLPPGGEKEVHAPLVDMMVDLEQRGDGEWLPPRLRKKVAARKTGMISSA